MGSQKLVAFLPCLIALNKIKQVVEAKAIIMIIKPGK
jgi:hypothetical protein